MRGPTTWRRTRKVAVDLRGGFLDHGRSRLAPACRNLLTVTNRVRVFLTWQGQHTSTRDVLLASAAMLIQLQFSMETLQVLDPAHLVLAVVLLIASAAPCAVRRGFPAGAMVATGVGYGMYLWLGYATLLGLCAIACAYTVGARRSLPVASAATATASGLTVVGIELGRAGLQTNVVTLVVFELVLVAAAVGAGHAAQLHTRQNERLQTLARQLHDEQAERAARAVAEDRLRIARELHDVVTHHISVISLQAGLARYVLDTDQQTSREALSTISEAGREAIYELRRMLGVLRAGDEQPVSLSPQPGLDDLDALMTRVREAGVPATLTIEGTPSPLPTGMGLCLYRILQEALTNVINHAGCAPTTACLHYATTDITLRVDNGPAPADAPPPSSTCGHQGGHGMSTMRERVELYGGHISSQHDTNGGFTVLASLPYPAGTCALSELSRL